MPQLGETVAEGKITKWFKSAGDAVKPGDNLFEIETDKVSMEVPAIAPGVITGNPRGRRRGSAGRRHRRGDFRARARLTRRRRSHQGATTGPLPLAFPRKRGLLLRRLPSRSSNAPCRTRRPIPLDPFREVRTPERNFGPARLAGGTVVTPLARRLAGEAGIDLARVTGSGPHGRVVARDVEIAIGAAKAAQPACGARAVRADGRAGQGALSRRRPTRKCRSTPCAAPSPSG